MNGSVEFHALPAAARVALWLTLACVPMTLGCTRAPGSEAKTSGTSDSTASDSGVSSGDGDVPIPDLPRPMYCDKPSDCPETLNCYPVRTPGPDEGSWFCQPHGGLELGEPCAPGQFVEECGHGLFCFGPYQTESSGGARCVPLCATYGGEDSIDFCAGEDDECYPIAGGTGPFIGVCSKKCADWLDSTDCDFGDQCFTVGAGCLPSRKPPAVPGTECFRPTECGVGRVCFVAEEGVCPGQVVGNCCGVFCDYTNPADTSCADAGLPSAVCVPIETDTSDPPEGFGVCSVV